MSPDKEAPTTDAAPSATQVDIQHPKTFGQGINNVFSSFDGMINALRAKVQPHFPQGVIRNSSRFGETFQTLGDVGFYMSARQTGVVKRAWAAQLSMVGTFLGMAFREKPQSHEDEEKMAKKPLLEYAATRIGQAFQPWKHIRQTVGLTTTIAGGVGLLASFDPNNTLKRTELPFNMVATAAGTSLLLTNKDDVGWKRFGAIFLANLYFGWKHTVHAFKEKNYWQMFGVISFQMANFVSIFLSGTRTDEKEKSTLPPLLDPMVKSTAPAATPEAPAQAEVKTNHAAKEATPVSYTEKAEQHAIAREHSGAALTA